MPTTTMLHVKNGGDTELKERLIGAVKKEVKQLMEESVTKKYVFEESSSVNSLCASVEACLSHGLRRRALGLFKTSSTMALIQKIAKNCPEADYINCRVIEMENVSEPIKRCSSSSDSSFLKPKLLSKGNSCSVTTINTVCSHQQSSFVVVKYLWIRLALFEKCLVKIIEFLVDNAIAYYDRDALVADPDYGSILSSLLFGPCALEYTRVKCSNFYWPDTHADELVQRHRISSGNRTPPTCHRPIINFKRSLHTSSEDSSSGSYRACSPANVAKDYVESLHQNCKTKLIYGKNNVLVLPKDVDEPMPGYLSLHQNSQSLTVKWTPNQLMNGYNEVETADNSSYWAYALNIDIDEFVYVHCHQNHGEDTGGTIILVGQDGVQRPPIHFPEGGHMQSFLSCLETGLSPHYQLDPPLWSERGIGKIFPWPRSVRRRILSSVRESSIETPIDYVFRVVSKSKYEEFIAKNPILEIERSGAKRTQLGSCSTTGSSDCSSKSLSIDQYPIDPPKIHCSQTASIELVCSTMRRQIISRAFYGWLAYCRHLSTVRTHLSGLVNGRITPDLTTDKGGLTKEKWEHLNMNGIVSNEGEVFRVVYFGGVQREIRSEVWPYLLGHYRFGSTSEEREKYDETVKHYYETTMSEWLAVEAIVREHEKEKNALAIAKACAEAGKLKQFDLDDVDLENEVFEDNDFSDISDPEEGYEIERILPPISRLRKISTSDSGNVEDGEDPENEMNENGFETVMDIDTIVVELKDIDGLETLVLEENCFGEISGNAEKNVNAVSMKSSPSTSSYETVGNEFFFETNVEQITNFSAEENGEKKGEDVERGKEEENEEEKEEEVEEEGEEEENIENNRVMSESGDKFKDDFQENKIPTYAPVIITDASLDITNTTKDQLVEPKTEFGISATLDALQEPKSACVSPASSNGGVYSSEFLKIFKTNLDGIEKDVHRCDRNYWYFANDNLEKLRNVITTYVWEHLDVGYMQGMCDLVAPLLVIFDDESKSYGCFCKLMERMVDNFPKGGAMDMHFANMRSLIQILDSEMYDLMDSNGDYTHFYFCYRWFLLDFKREFIYDDVFAIWEVIWAAKHVASSHFVLFLALALLETYRDIILSNSMNFTDVIKFFNEMAERHNAQSILQLSRSLALQLQTIIENK